MSTKFFVNKYFVFNRTNETYFVVDKRVSQSVLNRFAQRDRLDLVVFDDFYKFCAYVELHHGCDIEDQSIAEYVREYAFYLTCFERYDLVNMHRYNEYVLKHCHIRDAMKTTNLSQCINFHF